MKSKVVVVTGGTGGIGTAISRKMAEQSYQTIACYYRQGNHHEAKAWQDEQKQAGLHIDVVYADISSFEDCKKLTAEVIERFGTIDILINNAGVTSDSSFKKMKPEQWHQVINANLNGIYNITQNVIPFMLEQSYGRIINIASINGRKGQFGQCNYAAAKAGLYGFTKSLAREVAKYGITVNTISPGYTKTPMVEKMKQAVLDEIIADIPIGRLAYPEEIAAGVAFLASPEAGFITGANLDINGGQYM